MKQSTSSNSILLCRVQAMLLCSTLFAACHTLFAACPASAYLVQSAGRLAGKPCSYQRHSSSLHAAHQSNSLYNGAVSNAVLGSRRSRSMTTLLASTNDKSSSSSSSSFDETSYETDRLSKDAKAMEEMKQIATEEFSKLRTPWKWKIRKAVWDYLEEKDLAQFPRPVHHRIPNFIGADDAAENLASLPEFQSASMVKVNPDTPQRQVRHLVLENGKTLLTPQPRLRTGFFSTLKHGTEAIPSDVPIEALTSSKGAAKNGTPITLYEKYTVDLVVVGSTAVCPTTGARVGKGEGFAELEWGSEFIII